MATETEIYRIIVETQGGRELLTLNRTMKSMASTTKTSATEMSKFSNVLGKTNRSVGQRNNALTNVSYQIADIAVQLELGTDAGRVFAQQMPQLLGGFGLLGASVGAVAAIVPTVIRLLNRGLADALKNIEKQLESSNEQLEEFVALNKALAGTLPEFIKEFGGSSKAIKDFANSLKQLQNIKIENELDNIATFLEQLTARQTVLGFGTGKTRVQKVRDDLLELGSAMRRSQRQEIAEFLALLGELDNPGTSDSRRILLFQELNRRVIEAAGGIQNATEEQKSFIEATAKAAITYQKIVAEQSKVEGLQRKSYGVSREQERIETLTLETTKERANQARYEAAYLQALGAEQEKNAKILERQVIEHERYAKSLQEAARLENLDDKANKARQFAAYTKQLGEQQEKNAKITAKQIIEHERYAKSLAEAVKLETNEQRANQARQFAAYTKQMGEEMARTAAETARMNRELAVAVRNANQVATAIRNITNASASIGLSNIGREAELAALRAGETVEFARAASEIAQEEQKLTEALQNARSTGQIQAASAELEAFKNAKAEELSLEKQINIEREKRQATAGGGAGGTTPKEEAENYKLLREAIESTFSPLEQTRIEAQNLERALQEIGATSELWVEYPDGVKRVQEAIANLREETDSWQTDIVENIGGTLGNALADIATQAKSTSDVFKASAQSILQELGKILAKWLTFKILTAGFGFDVPNPFASSAGTVASSGISGASAAVSAGAAAGRSSASLARSVASPLASAATTAAITATTVAAFGKASPSSGSSGSGSGSDVNVYVNNNATGAQAITEERDGNVYVTVEDIRNVVSNDIVNGGNNIATSIERTYRMSRAR